MIEHRLIERTIALLTAECDRMEREKTIGIGMTTELVRGDVFYWGALMGGALLASIPVAILYTVFLDRIISGIAVGAGKK